jgi:hypothetical protein
MAQVNQDLFGEQRIRIDGNPKLEGIANHILNLYKINPNLLDGETIGEINRRVHLEILLDNGLATIIQRGSLESFKEWYLDKKSNPDTEEECARALRFLVSKDMVRLPSKAIQEAERQRQRIARSVR